MATLTTKISEFVAKARTKVRALQKELIGEFDYSGYQSDRSDDLLLKASETYDFIDLLQDSAYGGLTERQVSDTIDFFNYWLELNKVLAENYISFSMPIIENLNVPSGSYATATDLAAEILARIAADTNLSARITALEDNQVGPDDILPPGFLDEVVYTDDIRLHTHSNSVVLNALTTDDLTRIQSLLTHFNSIGGTGVHVSTEDRTNWNAKISSADLTTILAAYSQTGHTHSIANVSGLASVLNSINNQILALASDDAREIVLQRNGDDLEWRYSDEEVWQSLGSIKGDTGEQGDPFLVAARGDSNDRFSAAYNEEDENFTFLEEDTGYLYFRNPGGGDATVPAGWNNGIKFLGDNGWAPVLAVTQLSTTKSVLELIDWTGGSGSKPVLNPGTNPPNPIRWYLGLNGYTLTPDLAINILGPAGPPGSGPVIGAVDSLANRGAYDDQLKGFTFLRNDVSPQTIYQKLSDASGHWSSELPWQGPPGTGGSTLFASDTTVVLDTGENFGKYKNGDVIPSSGKTAVQVILDALNKYKNPAFTSFSISGQAVTVEVGATISGSKTFTWGINENSGDVDFIDIFDVTAGTILLNDTANDGSQAVEVTPIQLNINGATQQFKGILHDETTEQDIDSLIFTITARFYRFFSPVSEFPEDSDDLRPLNSAYHTGASTFNLQTGTAQTKFLVALPPGVTISSVVDLDALNADITSSYVLTGTIDLVDAGGANRAYNIYQMTVGVPYSSNHRHQITTAS